MKNYNGDDLTYKKKMLEWPNIVEKIMRIDSLPLTIV